MDELVSVVITTYKRTDALKNAIESVINQTYKNIEVIVVDDNAQIPDARKEVVEIMDSYKDCKLILNETNLGGSLSRNEGIKASKGAFVSFLDDDDTYMPQRIERYMSEYFNSANEKIGIIYSFVDAVNSAGEKIGEYEIVPTDKPLLQHMRSCLAATSQWMIPKKVFGDVGMFEDTPCKQDSIMLLKILGAGYEPLCVKEHLSNYTEHESGRISTLSQRNVVGFENFRNWCRKYYDQISVAEAKMIEAANAYQLLNLHIRLNNKKAAWQQWKVIFANNSFSVLCIKGLAKLLIGKRG